jgi:hypothetical protein
MTIIASPCNVSQEGFQESLISRVDNVLKAELAQSVLINSIPDRIKFHLRYSVLNATGAYTDSYPRGLGFFCWGMKLNIQPKLQMGGVMPPLSY